MAKRASSHTISHPFTEAFTKNFASGGVIPIVCGAFGEVNMKTHDLIKSCAKLAAAKADNSDVTPEDVSSAKGSPYNLILSQFRKAIGCLTVRTAAEEKLRKIMLIRSSRSEAHNAAESAASNHRGKYHTGSLRWYKNFRNESFFHAFYRYQTQFDNFYQNESE